MPAQSRKAISAVPPPEEGRPSHLTTRLGYVGLDVSQAEVVACLLLPDGREAVRRWSVANTQPGAEALAGRLATLAREHHLTGLRIGLAATNLYWWHLACLLRDTPLLAGRVRAV
jgi:transposase